MMEYVWVGIILVALVATTVVGVKDLRSQGPEALGKFLSTVAIGGAVMGVAAVGLAVTMFMG